MSLNFTHWANYLLISFREASLLSDYTINGSIQSSRYPLQVFIKVLALSFTHTVAYVDVTFSTRIPQPTHTITPENLRLFRGFSGFKQFNINYAAASTQIDYQLKLYSGHTHQGALRVNLWFEVILNRKSRPEPSRALDCRRLISRTLPWFGIDFHAFGRSWFSANLGIHHLPLFDSRQMLFESPDTSSLQSHQILCARLSNMYTDYLRPLDHVSVRLA